MKQLLALLSGLFLMASTNVQARQVKSKNTKWKLEKERTGVMQNEKL